MLNRIFKRGRKKEIENRTNWNAFEAARQSGFRGYFYFPDLDVRSTTRRHTRHAIAQKARWLYNNLGLARAIIHKPARYIAGTGIWPRPMSGDRAWDKNLKDLFDDRLRDPAYFDVAGEVSFYTAQHQIIHEQALFGDHFGQPTLGDNGQPMMRFIPGYLIDQSADDTELDRPFRDGVRTSPLGRAMKYRLVNNVTERKRVADIDARDIQHYRGHLLAGQKRGVSILAHACDHLFDIDEILQFEKAGVKLSSQVGYVIKVNSPSGLSGAPEINLGGRGRTRTTSTNADGTTTGLTVDRIYGDGSLVPQLQTNEELQMMKSERPSSAFTGFLDYLARDVAVGSDYTYEFIWNAEKLGGTSFRGVVLEDNQHTFEDRQQNLLIPQYCQPFYNFAVWQWMKAGVIDMPAGGRWWYCRWMTPRKSTVDRGRDGKLLSELVAQGLMSPDDYHGELGEDVEDVEDRTIETHIRRMEKIKAAADVSKIALEYDRIFAPPPGRGTPPAETASGADPN